MRYSQLFGKTVKSVPSDMKAASHKLLYQGGFVRESTAGRYYFLPLGMKVRAKIIDIVREEMNKAGAQELLSPILHPLELWKETNRTNEAGFELMKVLDRRKAQFALGGTAEEMMVDVVRKFQLSYRDLPFNIYQFSEKFRDELRARGGLLRVREFTMKDGYSFHADEKDFKKEYKNMRDTYSRIFKRLGMDTDIVEADNGYIGGEYCHEFVVESLMGESRYFTDEKGYCAHEDVALFQKDNKNNKEDLKELIHIDAKRGRTMEDGVKLHGLPLWQQIKDVLYVDEKGRFILAIIRGDFDVNETKLKHIAGSIELRAATHEEIRDQIHSEPGFISPVGIKNIKEKHVELVVVADDSLRTVHNAYGGDNALYKDLMNINIDRDYTPDLEGDIAMVQEGFTSLQGLPLQQKKGIEVGNIFQLGYHYSNLMNNATYTASDGTQQKYYMGCYGIGIGRTMAAIVEKHHDQSGIVWPDAIAPFAIHLIDIRKQSKGYEIYKKLTASGIEVLWDDREDISAGEKFADADLIGIPARLIVSEKTGGKVETTTRSNKQSSLLDVETLIKQFTIK